MSVLLAPCPFCGNIPTLCHGGPGLHFVRCLVCHATGDDGSQARAIEVWNRRAVRAVDQAALRKAVFAIAERDGWGEPGNDGAVQEAIEGAGQIVEAYFAALPPLPSGEAVALTDVDSTSFQSRVHPWMMACFGPAISGDRLERGDRMLEEVLELLQSGDYPAERVAALTDYVYSRTKGEPAQEVGGAMVTLAAYCLAHGLDMHEAGETELARIWTKVDQIRAKQAAKPTGSALPVDVRPAPDATASAVKAEQEAEKWCRLFGKALDALDECSEDDEDGWDRQQHAEQRAEELRKAIDVPISTLSAVEAEREAEKLREALQPFADVQAEYDPEDEDDETPATLVVGSVTDYSLTLGDFRRARTPAEGTATCKDWCAECESDGCCEDCCRCARTPATPRPDDTGRAVETETQARTSDFKAGQEAMRERAARAVGMEDRTGRDWLRDSLWDKLTGEAKARVLALPIEEGLP